MAERSVLWQELTAEEIGALAQGDAVVVLPVASTEQHGPHLGTGVDSILCAEVCRLAGEKASARRPCVVAPTLWMGMAEHHMAFGGTFTFDIPTYRAVLLAILKSVARAGFRKVAIVNGHGGNMSALNAFLPDFAQELDLDIRATTYFMLARYAHLLERQKSVMHACEAEASMMLAVRPQAVREGRLAEAVGPSFDDPDAVLRPPWQRFRSFKEISPNGVIGDASVAARDKGEAILAACVEALAAEITAWRG